jgi:flagellar hook assembly protein FlgD
MTVNRSSLSSQHGSKALTSDSNTISKYIKNVSTMNKTTAYVYLRRLTSFKSFISNAYNLTVDELNKRIKDGNEDVFEVINEYSSYLSDSNWNIMM